jgi:hypothetical protein
MSEPNYRQERIERLLHELKYEVTRGMLESEIDEHLGFRFIVPVSRKIPNGVVMCEFRTRPSTGIDNLAWGDEAHQPKLRVVKP